jgi:hypothetical protein
VLILLLLQLQLLLSWPAVGGQVRMWTSEAADDDDDNFHHDHDSSARQPLYPLLLLMSSLGLKWQLPQPKQEQKPPQQKH